MLRCFPYCNLLTWPNCWTKGRVAVIWDAMTLMWLCIHDVPWPSHHVSLQWRHNGRDSVSNHQPYDCLFNRWFRRRSKKTSKLRVTGLCAGNSPGTGEFPAQMASTAENVSIWWRHHVGQLRTENHNVKISALPKHNRDEAIMDAIRRQGRQYHDVIIDVILRHSHDEAITVAICR